jgi:hypothetical protein
MIQLLSDTDPIAIQTASGAPGTSPPAGECETGAQPGRKANDAESQCGLMPGWRVWSLWKRARKEASTMLDHHTTHGIEAYMYLGSKYSRNGTKGPLIGWPKGTIKSCRGSDGRIESGDLHCRLLDTLPDLGRSCAELFGFLYECL